VSGAAFPKSLQGRDKSRGVDAYQAFGTADLGLIAFETSARQGMVVNEDLIVESCDRHGDPWRKATSARSSSPRLTSITPYSARLGDLTAAPGTAPADAANAHQGWMGRADQTTQGQGHVVRPEQIAEIGKRHPELGGCASSSPRRRDRT